ncbi:two-component system response regulator PilR (NtrC family) [Zhongshania antarctica]|uniref:Two-component system response regulator PilR (NtrC family) n=1 Tax=Zhongshania antarctica TaxID=641702 RepID=A0A840R659_9GAMM|nr:sigma-54 dependent transcriptional regulator [Zhongshania antarctica]MBB5188028.1 two-component system response regulator PilR (NtrC family) [Zhongshania antarctica]
MQQSVLIIDDEPDIRELLEITISRMGLHTIAVGNVRDAIQALSQNENINLCLTDIKLPDGSGLEIVRHIQQNAMCTAVAVLTAYGSTELAVEALKAGAFDFINKPVSVEQLRSLVKTALKLDRRETQVDGSSNTRLLGETQSIINLREQILKLSRSQAPVYISGESGSGKEVVARLIHANGPRSDAPFVPVNCGAIPSELVESEFFGHSKGSFTGAYDHKEGLFEAANGGTLFLDEVADLPLNMQVKLLRAIQEKAVRRIGSTQEIPVDVRILSATHRDLAKAVAAEHFRSDLFYRINVIEVQVPSLRDRASDIPLLAKFLLEKIGREWGVTPPTLDKSALASLCVYGFPGNVRELENIIERAATLCENNTITASDLSLPSIAPQAHSNASAPDKGSHFAAASGQLEEYIAGIEKEIIADALEANRWNKTESAKNLGLTFRQFRYKLKKYNLE